MTTAALDAEPASTISAALMRPAPSSTDALGEEIAELAARLHAATYELLVLLRESDARTVQRALEAAADRLCRDAQALPEAERLSDEVAPAQRRADALGLLAEVALASDLDRGPAGDRYQVVLHVEALTGVAAGQSLSGTLEVDHGAVDVSAETSKRISCDAAVVPMHHGDDDAVLDVGRKTRTVPPSIRRALQARDRRCRFPGCTARRCDAHHVVHWIDGGATRLDNLVLLCRRHHRAVHEGGFEVSLRRDGTTIFLRRDGSAVVAAPALPAVFARPEDSPREPDDIPVWDGTPFDLVYAIDVLYAPRVQNRSARSLGRTNPPTGFVGRTPYRPRVTALRSVGAQEASVSAGRPRPNWQPWSYADLGQRHFRASCSRRDQ